MSHRVILLLLLVAFSLATPLLGDDAEPSPFRSVSATRDTVMATLPQGRRWLVKVDSSHARLSNPGESFTLQAGSSLRLIERHSSYVVTARLEAPAGLLVKSTFDARSSGGKRSEQSFFLPAR